VGGEEFEFKIANGSNLEQLQRKRERKGGE